MMRAKRAMPAAVTCAALGLLATGCLVVEGDRDAEEGVREGLEQAGAGLREAAESMRDALGELGEGMVEEPLDFRELRAWLPEELAGFRRVEREGETGGVAGLDVSRAEAVYETDGGGRITVEIVDVGAVAGPAVLGMASWLDVRVDRENDRGRERTLEYRGYPAYEEYREGRGDAAGDGEFAYIVERRFIVKVTGRDVEMEEIEDVRDAIGVEDLADRAGEEG